MTEEEDFKDKWKPILDRPDLYFRLVPKRKVTPILLTQDIPDPDWKPSEPIANTN